MFANSVSYLDMSMQSVVFDSCKMSQRTCNMFSNTHELRSVHRIVLIMKCFS